MKKRNLKPFPFLVCDEDKFKKIRKFYFWEGAVADYVPKTIGLQWPYTGRPFLDTSEYGSGRWVSKDTYAVSHDLFKANLAKGMFNLDLVFLQNKGVPTIFLEYQYTGTDWMFIKDSGVILLINDSENLSLKSSEVDTNTGYKPWVETMGIKPQRGSFLNERGIIPLSVENLVKIAEAETIAMQVSGKKGTVELSNDDFLRPRFCDSEILTKEFRIIEDRISKDAVEGAAGRYDRISEEFDQREKFLDELAKNNGLYNSLIFTSRCMYHAFVDNKAYAEEVNRHIEWIKEMQYEYFPETNPYSQWEKISGLAQDEKVKSFLPKKYWTAREKALKSIDAKEKELELFEKTARELESISEDPQDPGKQVEDLQKELNNFAKEVGLSSYELVREGCKDELLGPLFEVHEEFGQLKGEGETPAAITEFLLGLDGKAGDGSQAMEPTRKAQLLGDWLIENKDKDLLPGKKWKEYDSLVHALSDAETKLEGIKQVDAEWTAAALPLEEAKAELDKLNSGMSAFEHSTGKELYELVSSGVQDPLLNALSQIHQKIMDARKKMAELDSVEGVFNKAKAMAETLVLTGMIKIYESNIEVELLKAGKAVLAANRESELLKSESLKESIASRRQAITDQKDKVDGEKKKLIEERVNLSKKLGAESLPPNGTEMMVKEASAEHGETQAFVSQWIQNTAMEFVGSQDLGAETAKKMQAAQKKLDKTAKEVGLAVLEGMKEVELVKDASLKKKIKAKRKKISETETEITKQEKGTQKKHGALLKKLGLDAIPEKGVSVFIETKKTELEDEKQGLDQWGKEITRHLIDSGEKKWPKNGPLRELLESL